MRWLPRLRGLRPQLRARITALFAIGAFALSGLVATFTFFAARSTVVGQAVTAAELSAEGDATQFSIALEMSSATTAAAQRAQLSNTLAQIDNGNGVHAGSIYYPTGKPALDELDILEIHVPPETVSASDLPPSLLRAGQKGDAAEQVFAAGNNRLIGVAIPLSVANHSGVYIEVLPTGEVSGTLTRLVDVLLIGSVMTIIAGAVIGHWAARRVLRPLRDASRAAASIANGELGTRIKTGDASDLAVLASSFNQMVDRLEERIAREARFTSDVSHELRSPLTTLATALEVVRTRRAELSEPGQSALDLLASEVRRFQLLVTDLLEISRVDAGVEGFDESLVEVGPLVEHALVNAGIGDVAVTMRPSDAKRWLFVDKRRFERIVTNLAENASRYADGATHVAVETDDHIVRVNVDDDGPGVPVEDRERIFDRFARGTVAAGTRGRGGGSGLGLALVAEHARVHGGRAWVEDAPSGGARFVVELPLAPDDVVEANAGEERAEEQPDEPPPAPAPDPRAIDPEWPGP